MCVCVWVQVLVRKVEPGIDLLPWLYPGEGVERERGLKEPNNTPIAIVSNVLFGH